MIIDGITRIILLTIAVYAGLSGIRFFVVGLLRATRRADATWHHAWSAAFLTCSYYLFRLVFA